MKKFFILFVSVILCLSVLSGCGSTDSLGKDYSDDIQDLKDRIEKLEDDAADLAARLTLAEGKLSSGEVNHVYSVGNEVTISSYGYDLFKIKLVSVTGADGASSLQLSLLVTNINMPNIKCAEYIAVTYYTVDYGDGRYFWGSDNRTVTRGDSNTLLLSSYRGVPVSHVSFGFPDSDGYSGIPYALFQI